MLSIFVDARNLMPGYIYTNFNLKEQIYGIPFSKDKNFIHTSSKVKNGEKLKINFLPMTKRFHTS